METKITVKHINGLKADADALTAKIKSCDKKKALILESTKFPVDGLSFGENRVDYKGIPFGQCSSAEQLRVSVGMAVAMNPRLRIMLIRDGSLLDESNRRILAEMAEENDAQIWIECVSEGEPVGIVIEDGSILSTK